MIFASLDVMTGSILPSLILHFLNNSLSIIYTNVATGYEIYFVLILIGLALISLVPVFLLRKKYAHKITSTFENDGKIPFSYEVVAFALVTLFVSITSLK